MGKRLQLLRQPAWIPRPGEEGWLISRFPVQVMEVCPAPGKMVLP